MLMRLALVAAIASLFATGLPVLTAAESGLAPTPDTLAAATAPAGTLRVPLGKNGNVRFAPTTQSKVIVTLPARTEVEILGPAKVAGWFVIRFPREGNAWVHSKVLQSVDGGKRWRVTEDKARARDDSTLGAAIVGELQKGEILEDKGRLNGDWRAVYLPNAVAYISASVLDMPTNVEQAKQDAAQRADNAAAAWASAQSVYASYYDALQKNPQNALVLDWAGLGRQFDAVIRDHRDPDTRLSAQRLKDGIVNVAAAAANLQKAKGITPVEVPSDIPAMIAAQQTTTTPVPHTVPTVLPANSKITDVGDPTVPEKLTVPGEVPSLVVPVPPAEIAPVAPLAQKPAVATPAAFAVEGFVTQQKFEGVGVSEVLVDGDSNVVAFLSIKVGKDIQLSEYYWRWVGVRGELQKVDQAKHNLGRDVPLVIVDELSLSGR
jgi:hypothetical protein